MPAVASPSPYFEEPTALSVGSNPREVEDRVDVAASVQESESSLVESGLKENAKTSADGTDGSSTSTFQPIPQATPKPTIVHGYELHETLGTGTFGRVRRATKDGAECAIKIVSRKQLALTSMTPQLKREVAIQKSLHHPNIVQLRQVLRSPNKLYMVLELAAEGELYWSIQRNGPLCLAVARKALFQLSDALLYCHERGIIHRDVKPENILLDCKRNIKLTDFGLSSSSDPSHAHAYGGVENLPDPRLLQTACGSPHYCAPEVRSPGPSGCYDGRKADSWSVGVVLFLMINGYLPFHHENPTVLQNLVENHPVAFPPTMPAQPREICEMLMCRDPARRWSLDQVLQHEWCRDDPTLKRAVQPHSVLTADDTEDNHIAHGESSLEKQKGNSSTAPEGWYMFGQNRVPDAPCPGTVPRETAAEFPEDGSFSDADSNAGSVRLLSLKPRLKSMLTVRSFSKARSMSGRDECNKGAASFLKKNRRESSVRRREPEPRRRLSSLFLHGGEDRAGEDDESNRHEEFLPGKRRSMFSLSRKLLSVAGFASNRKPSVAVPV